MTPVHVPGISEDTATFQKALWAQIVPSLTILYKSIDEARLDGL